jgi:hypothetical protein
MDQNPFDQFMEHQRKAIDEAGKAVDALLPPAFKEHSKAALDEAVKGFQALFEGTLDGIKEEFNKMGKDSDESSESNTGANKVKVELS